MIKSKLKVFFMNSKKHILEVVKNTFNYLLNTLILYMLVVFLSICPLSFPLFEKVIKDWQRSKNYQNGHYPQETTDLVTFIEERRNGKLHFFCSNYTKIF